MCTQDHNNYIADCSIPMVNSNISLNYGSTLENSLLTFQCKDGLLPNDVFTSRCYRNQTWIPDPLNHVCATSLASKIYNNYLLYRNNVSVFLSANCGDPPHPSDGYLEPYTSTIEGAKVNRVHLCQNGQLVTEDVFCNPDGQWQSVNGSACPDTDSKSTVNLLSAISGSLGSLAVVLLVCGILVVVIVIGRKKGIHIP